MIGSVSSGSWKLTVLACIANTNAGRNYEFNCRGERLDLMECSWPANANRYYVEWYAGARGAAKAPDAMDPAKLNRLFAGFDLGIDVTIHVADKPGSTQRRLDGGQGAATLAGRCQHRRCAHAGRALDSTPPKDRLPAGFRKSRVLFNFHRAAALDQPAVVVVEGYFDCLKVHQAGFRSVVGLMGTVLSDLPKRLLLERFRRVILMLDGDSSGRNATARIAAQLAGKCSVRLAIVPTGRQPDQLERDEILELLAPSLD